MDAKEDNKPLISVIVPIYNVEKYVRKCLDSLKNQTMKEIEVICIDDGSTDNSGKIADEYQNDGWPRFKVIYTKNRGLSAARNRGIDEAEAEWLMFVDSDDWVDEDFCRIPWETVCKENAEIVVFGSCEVNNGRLKRSKKTTLSIEIVDQEAAIIRGGVAAWDKLYKKGLFEEIRYPEGRVYEDIATTYKLIQKANRIVFLADHLYYHAKRDGSITQTKSISNTEDELVATLEIYDYLQSCEFPKDKLNSLLCGSAIRYLACTKPSQDHQNPELYQRATEIVDEVKGIPQALSVKQKIGLFAWRIDRRLFCFLCKIRRR